MCVCVCVCVCVTGHTGKLGELVGSHTKVAIYPPFATHSKGM